MNEFGYDGYCGKILRINLCEPYIRKELLVEDFASKYLGGRGFGARFLYNELNASTEPLGPENKLIFMTGPLAGTKAPLASRFSVTFKSPLTRCYAASLCGGFLATELKQAGYDGIIVEGRAKKPMYILIKNEQVQLKNATYLWGMTTDETQQFIKSENGNSNTKIACIGPAGENLVKFACIISDRRAAGRCGAGAVMGSKNLKAIAVCGNGELRIANPKVFQEAIADVYKKINASPLLKGPFKEYGTTNLVTPINENGILPTRNYQNGIFEYAEDISGEALKKYVVKKVGCYRCPLLCGRISIVKEGQYAGSLTEGPEYETLYSFGSNCGNRNLESIICADMMCDKLGLDTMTTGSVIGFAMECYEKGLINRNDTDGVELQFGNHNVIIQMIKKIAYRVDFGRILAEGVGRASKKIGKGSEHFALQSKNLEFGGYDPRGAKGAGLSYATCSRGGCHHFGGYVIPAEVTAPIVDRFAYNRKGPLVKRLRDTRVVWDSLILCTMAGGAIGEEVLAKLVSAATGINIDGNQLMEIGDRISNVERAFNIRAGLSISDDKLPIRLLEEPLVDGPAKGYIVELDPMLKEFYEVCGWDKTGIPTRKKLESLRLKEIADDLSAGLF